MEKTGVENYYLLKATVEAIDSDYTKFQNRRVKVCGNRVRNNLLNIKKLCDVLRKQILEDIKTIPTKHRVKKIEVNVEMVEEEEVEEVEEEVEEVKKVKKARKRKTKT